ncbi:hypothetical protein AAU01_32320 [Paenarthrobacter aurescens]|uniref:Uncharacterized protein n=1 Tax=Paenarthrobacter aurescens TaxID=43663 RepID=A0A4Y3NHJ9_PAEAU|nr:hypothetical protein AAU01_32320 [Paenarthrobacter aurescens]
MGNDVTSTGVGQGIDHYGNVRRHIGFRWFGDGVKAVPPKEEGVISKGHAMLLRPGRSTETAQAVDENYALLMH